MELGGGCVLKVACALFKAGVQMARQRTPVLLACDMLA